MIYSGSRKAPQEFTDVVHKLQKLLEELGQAMREHDYREWSSIDMHTVEGNFRVVFPHAPLFGRPVAYEPRDAFDEGQI